MDTKKNKIINLLKEHPVPYYTIVFFIGLVIILLLALNRSSGEYYFSISEPWSSTLANIGAGIMLVSIMYFTKEVFRSTQGQITFKQVEEIGNNVAKIQDEINIIKRGTSGVFYMNENDIHREIVSLMRMAKEFIEIIDIGYPCHCEESIKEADWFFEQLKSALDRGIKVKYYFSLDTAGVYWLRHMKTLLVQYEKKFFLFSRQSAISSKGFGKSNITPEIVFFIDSNAKERASCSIINTKYCEYNKLMTYRVRHAIFFYLNKAISDNVREGYATDFWIDGNSFSQGKTSREIDRLEKDLKDSFNNYWTSHPDCENLEVNEDNVWNICKEISTYEVHIIRGLLQENFLKLKEANHNNRLLFAYDHHMNSDEMRKYGARVISIATLNDYDLAIVYISSLRIVAKSSPGKKIWGYVFAIDEDKLKEVEKQYQRENHDARILLNRTNIYVELIIGKDDEKEKRNVSFFHFEENSFSGNKKGKSFSRDYKKKIEEATSESLVNLYLKERKGDVVEYFGRVKKMLGVN